MILRIIRWAIRMPMLILATIVFGGPALLMWAFEPDFHEVLEDYFEAWKI